MKTRIAALLATAALALTACSSSNPLGSAGPASPASSGGGTLIVGSQQYLTKPFTREELLGAIRTYVNA